MCCECFSSPVRASHTTAIPSTVHPASISPFLFHLTVNKHPVLLDDRTCLSLPAHTHTHTHGYCGAMRLFLYARARARLCGSAGVRARRPTSVAPSLLCMHLCVCVSVCVTRLLVSISSLVRLWLTWPAGSHQDSTPHTLHLSRLCPVRSRVRALCTCDDRWVIHSRCALCRLNPYGTHTHTHTHTCFSLAAVLFTGLLLRRHHGLKNLVCVCVCVCVCTDPEASSCSD